MPLALQLKVTGNAAKGGQSRPVLTRDDVSPGQGLELPYQYHAQFPVILGGSHSYVLHWDRFLPTPLHFTGAGFEKWVSVCLSVCFVCLSCLSVCLSVLVSVCFVCLSVLSV